MEYKKFCNVPNFLIFSYRLFLVISVVGLICGCFNFGHGPVMEQPDSWDKPRNNFADYDEFYYHKTRTEHYATYKLDPTFYVILPCGVGLLFAGCYVIVDIFYKDLRKTTVGLYSSLALLAIMVGLIGAYQHKSSHLPSVARKFSSSYSFVTTLHSMMLILILMQMILSIWHLCRQKVKWPTIHFSHLITLGFVVRGVLLILSVMVNIAFFISTLHGSRSSYDDEMQKFPAYIFMPFGVASLYTLLVPFEAICSQLFGHVHNRMMGISGFVFAFCHGFITIMSSPSVSDHLLFNHDKLSVALMFSIPCLVISLIYSPLCLFYPRVLNTPPAIIRYFAHGMSHMKCIDTQKENTCACKGSGMCRKLVAFCKNLKSSDSLRANLVMAISSFVSIILIVVADNYTSAIQIIMFTDISILYRTVPAFFSELSTGISPEPHPFQIVFQFCLENTPLLVGIIIMYFYRLDVLHIIANVINILIMIFRLYKIQTHPDVKAKISAALEAKQSETTEAKPSDEEAPLT